LGTATLRIRKNLLLLVIQSSVMCLIFVALNVHSNTCDNEAKGYVIIPFPNMFGYVPLG